ncbi:LysE family translocator [Paeniglutamicibacter kerguelensis]|uniref:Threonine/homoserine/homoserine lactone efflux protein n=1 Tax=Paeniglutamicibacter kerguelensis TaxID=254788 RepID=A0ABS4XD75_9MICC|nr:LysE family translocator [Paeniglutamicibacter kerguelensis]MBP2386427.1 threonine/homoserine/homoserine lactone efflux protein [Paeniglutamicibacter kerguelensis]
MTPGADWAYAIAAGLGRYRVVSAVAGLCTGYVFHTILIVAGMAALIASSPRLLSWLTLAGAAYLLWLGISTARSWRGAGFTVAAPQDTGQPSAATASVAVSHAAAAGDTALKARATTLQAASKPSERLFGPAFFRGLGTSGTNPKALLLYLALIPQFVRPDAALSVPAQTAIFGLSHMTLSVFIYSGVAIGARVLLRSRPTAARAVTLFSGLIMIGLGLVLVIEQAPTLLASFQILLSVVGK